MDNFIENLSGYLFFRINNGYPCLPLIRSLEKWGPYNYLNFSIFHKFPSSFVRGTFVSEVPSAQWGILQSTISLLYKKVEHALGHVLYFLFKGPVKRSTP